MSVLQQRPSKRESSRGLPSQSPFVIQLRDFRNLPDFEQVRSLLLLVIDWLQIYHLVIDAIDTYNERWEKECKIQEAARLDRERQEELAKEEMNKIKDHRDKVIKQIGFVSLFG
jgi:hypothetical protein